MTPDDTLWFGQPGARTQLYLDVASAETWQASLTSRDWLEIEGPDHGQGPAMLTLLAAPNCGGRRSARMRVTRAGGKILFERTVAQASAEALGALNTSVLSLPFPNVPRIMELGIAGKFIAQEIQKIPEPFDLIALVIVEVIVIAAGVLVMALRALFSVSIPEPKTWYPAPPPFSALTSLLSATGIFITEETYLTALYIAEETLGE